MEVVDRLHARLRQALESRGGDPHEPFTVADLYQRLVPYRAVRDQLGLLELAPYEHALLRLLAGENGHLIVEDAGVVEDLRRELGEPNPILGVYRDYAHVEVRLARAGDAASHAPGSAGYVAPPLHTARNAPELATLPDAGTTPAPAAEAGASSGREPGEGVDADPRVEYGNEPGADLAAPSGASVTDGPCIRCRAPLPDVEGLRFCPACGADQQPPACDGCGSAMDPEWAFCVHCGRARAEN
jgi:hypothetical protein